MPYVLDWEEDGGQVYIPDDIRCSWTNEYWGTCIKGPRHDGRHMIIGHEQTVRVRGRYKELPYGELITVPAYTRRSDLPEG